MLFQIYSGPSLNISRAMPVCLSVLSFCHSINLPYVFPCFCMSMSLFFVFASLCGEGSYYLFSIILSHFRLFVVSFRFSKRFRVNQGHSGACWGHFGVSLGSLCSFSGVIWEFLYAHLGISQGVIFEFH